MFTVYPQCSCSPTFGSAVILESNRNLVITQLMWPMTIVFWAKESQGEIAGIIYLRLLNSGNLLQLYNTIYFEQECGQDRKTYIQKFYFIHLKRLKNDENLFLFAMSLFIYSKHYAILNEHSSDGYSNKKIKLS